MTRCDSQLENIHILNEEGLVLQPDEENNPMAKYYVDTEAAPYFYDSYFEYAQYLYLVSFVKRIHTGNWQNWQEEYWDLNTGDVKLKMPEFVCGEMPDYASYLKALELYYIALAELTSEYEETIKVIDPETGNVVEITVHEFKPLLKWDTGNGVKTRDESWELVKPTYSGIKWTYENYESALEGYEERLTSEDGLNRLPGSRDDEGIIESKPTFNNYFIRPTQVLEGQSASAGYYLSNIVQITAGDDHVVALRKDGSVYGWGDNSRGQLGVDLDYSLVRAQSQVMEENEVGKEGATFSYRVPIRILAGDNASQEKAAELYSYRNHEKVAYMNNVVGITAGTDYTMLLLSDGTVWSFGEDDYGQLGDGKEREYYDINDPKLTDPDYPITVEELVADRVIRNRIPAAIQVQGLEDKGQVVQVAGGGNTSLALTANGKIYAWGSNLEGQLGLLECDLGETDRTAFTGVPVAVNKGLSANPDASDQDFTQGIRIAVGTGNSAVLKSTGYVWNWGDNTYGQLGNSSTERSYIAVQAGDGDSKTLLLSEYYVKELKDGAEELVATYDQTKPLGESNPSQLVLAEGQFIEFDLNNVLYSYRTGFNLFTDGENTAIKDQDALTVGAMDPTVLDIQRELEDGGVKVRADGTGKLGLTSVYVDYNTAGVEGGSRDSNMLTLPVWVRHVQKYADEGDDDASSAFAVSAAPMVDAGNSHSIALDSMGRVWVWGSNDRGQLGLKEYATLTYPVQILDGKKDEKGRPITFSAVAAGDNFSLALDNLGRVWAWGDNENNQLGRGNDTRVDCFVPEMVSTDCRVYTSPSPRD